MAATSSFGKAVKALDNLNRNELIDLRGVIDRLLDADPAVQGEQPSEGYIEERYITKTLSNGTVKTYGPYLYRKVRKGDTVTSEYLGPKNGRRGASA